MEEAELERKCARMAKRRGCMLLKLPADYQAGMPDRILVSPWKLDFIEFKGPRGRIRPSQEAFFKKLEALGHEVWIFDRLDQFEGLLEARSPLSY